MPSFEWKRDFETGNPVIDGQHKDIFRLLSLLSDSIKNKNTNKAIKEVVEKLTLHFVEHFRDEEALMLAKDYPLIEEHRHIHEDLFEKAVETLEEYRTDEKVIAIPLVCLLSELITKHIQTEDKKFFDWLKTKN